MLVPLVIMATSIGSSLYSFVSDLQARDLTVPPPPQWVADIPLVGHSLKNLDLVATSIPAALAKYGQTLKGTAARLVSFAGDLAVAELVFVLSFIVAAVLIAYGKGAAEFAERLLEVVTGSRGARRQAGRPDGGHGPGRGPGRRWRRGDPVTAARRRLLRHRPSGSRAFDACSTLAGDHSVAGVAADTACHRLCLRNGNNHSGDHLSGWSLVAGVSDNILKPLMLGRGLEDPCRLFLLA